MELEPILMTELDVPPTRVAPRASRRALIAIGAVAALVGYGFAGRLSDVPEPAAAPAAEAVVETPAFPAEPPRSIIDVPAEAATIRGAVVPVAGSVPPQVEWLRIRALAGRVVVAEQLVRPVEDRFDVRLAVALPGDGRPVPVTIAVGDAAYPERDLVRRTVSVVQSSPVAVATTRTTQLRDYLAVVEVSGVARQTVSEIVLEAAGRRTDADLIGWRWQAELEISRRSGPLPVTLHWTDGASTGSILMTVP